MKNIVTDKEFRLFLEGNNFYAYKFMGCHNHEEGGKEGYIFRVWAPNAESTSLFCTPPRKNASSIVTPHA